MTGPQKKAVPKAPSPAYAALNAPVPEPAPEPARPPAMPLVWLDGDNHVVGLDRPIPWCYHEDYDRYLRDEDAIRTNFVRHPASDTEVVLTIKYGSDVPAWSREAHYIGYQVAQLLTYHLDKVPRLVVRPVGNVFKCLDYTEIHFEFEDIWLLFTTELDWRKSIAPEGIDIRRAYRSPIWTTSVMLEVLHEYWLDKEDARYMLAQPFFDGQPPLYKTDPVHFPITPEEQRNVASYNT